MELFGLRKSPTINWKPKGCSEGKKGSKDEPNTFINELSTEGGGGH